MRALRCIACRVSNLLSFGGKDPMFLPPHLNSIFYDNSTPRTANPPLSDGFIFSIVWTCGWMLPAASSSALSQKLGPRLFRMFLAPLFPIMLHNLVQQTRGFTCAVNNPFINRRARQLLTTTGGVSPATSSPRDYANTSVRPRGHLFSSTTNDNGAIPITVLSGFLGR